MGSSHPLRCAIVPPAPAPYREPLFRALSERDGLEILVIYQSSGQPSWDVASEWFALEHPYAAAHLPSLQYGRPGRTPIIWPRRLERALRAFDPVCVVASEYGPATLRGLAWARRHGRAFVVFTEVTSEMEHALSAPQLRLHRWLARRADAVIAVSSAARDRLLGLGVLPERITVALQSAELAPIRTAATTRRPSANGTLTILSVGRLVPDKNFVGLLEAAAQLATERFQLQIVGVGPQEGWLRELAHRLSVPVRFEGHVPPSQLPSMYAAADIYALVSTYEPFGVTVREAAAAGLPIICSRVAGAAGDVAVPGRNAILVEPTSVEDVTVALGRLISDSHLRGRMAAASREVDADTDGHDVEAFAAAVEAATHRRRRPTR